MDIIALENDFTQEYNIILQELYYISDNYSVTIKNPRGRPLKYVTEDERKKARKIYRKKYYQKKSNKKFSV